MAPFIYFDIVGAYGTMHGAISRPTFSSQSRDANFVKR
jgi:hypothetical protein